MNENSVTHLFYILSATQAPAATRLCGVSWVLQRPLTSRASCSGGRRPLWNTWAPENLKIRCFPSPALRPAGTCKAHRITSEGNRGGREERGRKNSSSMRKFYCTPPPLPSSLAPSITLLVLLLPVSQRESRTETRLQHRWGKLLTSLSR